MVTCDIDIVFSTNLQMNCQQITCKLSPQLIMEWSKQEEYNIQTTSLFLFSPHVKRNLLGVKTFINSTEKD